jgi:DNA-binding protein YbaB
MMKQAQALQAKVAAVQEELKGREQHGLSGGGKV